MSYKSPIIPINTTVAKAGISIFPAAEDHDHGISAGGMTIGGTVTSGTTGSVLFVGAGPVLAQDNSNIFWDATNKFLGLQVAVPQAVLDIALPIGGSGTPYLPAALRFSQYNAPSIRYVDIVFTTNSGSNGTALQWRGFAGTSLVDSFFVTLGGKVGAGSFGGMSNASFNALDLFSVLLANNISSTYQGLSIIDASAPRLLLQAHSNAGPLTTSNAAQVSFNGSGNLDIASRGVVASDILFWTAPTGGTLAQIGTFSRKQNWLVGTASDSSTGKYGLIFSVGTALATMAAGTAGLYAQTTAGVTHLMAIASDGTTVQLV